MENFKPTINFSLAKYHKKERGITNIFFHERFEDLVQEQFSSSVHIYTDGSTLRGKASAVAITPQGPRKAVRLPDGTTPFITELYALLLAMELVESASTMEPFVVFSDCQDALRNLIYADNPLAEKILHKLKALTVLRGVTITFCWIPGHAGIDGNSRADNLAKLSVDRQDLEMVDVSWLDRVERPKPRPFLHRNGEDHLACNNKCIKYCTSLVCQTNIIPNLYFQNSWGFDYRIAGVQAVHRHLFLHFDQWSWLSIDCTFMCSNYHEVGGRPSNYNCRDPYFN